MKQITLSLAIIFGFFATGLAQDKEMKTSKSSSLSFGFNAGAPLGKSTNDIIQFVLGGDLTYLYSVASKITITASAGVDVWHGEKAKNFNYVPVLGGIKLFVSDKVFLSEQAGYSIGISKDPITAKRIDGAFTNVAGIGYKISKNSNILLAYKGLFRTGANTALNTLDVRVGYIF